MKKNTKKIILIIDIIIIIIIVSWLIISYFTKNDYIVSDFQPSNNGITSSGDFRFYKLYYKVPTEYKYEVYDEANFTITHTNETWSALAGFFFKDEDESLDSVYENTIKKNLDETIVNQYKIIINNAVVYVIESKNNKKIAYIFDCKSLPDSYYTFVVNYKDKKITDEELNTIFDSLLNPTIVDNNE